MRTKVLILVALCSVAVAGVWGSDVTSAGAAARKAPGAPPTERTGDGAVGASVAHSEELAVERERYTYDGTYGYTLWRPGPGRHRV